MRTPNRRVAAVAAASLLATAVAGAAVARDRSEPADPDAQAMLVEVREVQDRPAVDGTLVRAATEDPSRGGLGLWTYRSADGRDEAIITRGGRGVFVTGCPEAGAALALCGLRSRGGEGVVLVGRAGPGIEVVVVESGIATRSATPQAGHWMVLLPDSPMDPAAALPVRVEGLAGDVVVATADPSLPR